MVDNLHFQKKNQISLEWGENMGDGGCGVSIREILSFNCQNNNCNQTSFTFANIAYGSRLIVCLSPRITDRGPTSSCFCPYTRI